MINKRIFRAYDIRGLVKDDFTDTNVLLLGKGIGTFLKEGGAGSVVLARDDRISSPNICEKLIQGLLSTGLNVVDVGRVPTPVLYFAVVHLDLDGGVMISGSHTPPEYNGIKIAGEKLTPIYGDDIQKIRKIIEQEDFVVGAGILSEHTTLLDEYTHTLKQKFNFKRRLKIVVDAANGMTSLVLPKFWESFGHEVVCLYCESDGSFPNHTADTVVPEFYVDLQKKVVEVGADVGIGYDGDGDRFGVVDERGSIIQADRIAALLIQQLLKKNKGAEIIFDVRCSQMLPEVVQKAGGTLTLWRVGNTPIKAKMRETGALFGGELSGHMMYKNFFMIDDGLYNSGRLLELLSTSDKTLSRFDEELPRYVSSHEIHLEVPDEKKFEVIDALTKDFKKEHEVIDIDGARVVFRDGWGLVRASNTGPQIKLRFEAHTQDRLKEIMRIFKAQLETYPAVLVTKEDFSVV